MEASDWSISSHPKIWDTAPPQNEGGATFANEDMESTGSSISGRLDFSAQPLNGQPSASPSPASPAGSASAHSDAVDANDF